MLLDLGENIIAFDVANPQDATTVIVNLGPEPVELPQDATVITSGVPGVTDGVPTDATVWLAQG